ncbi:MAG: hypothetical protein KDB27_30050 [Planctomycetales bacterium]|nr:hypothetical protein [Planctomycetales bacterium]
MRRKFLRDFCLVQQKPKTRREIRLRNAALDRLKDRVLDPKSMRTAVSKYFLTGVVVLWLKANLREVTERTDFDASDVAQILGYDASRVGKFSADRECIENFTARL